MKKWLTSNLKMFEKKWNFRWHLEDKNTKYNLQEYKDHCKTTKEGETHWREWTLICFVQHMLLKYEIINYLD